jgi:putative transposase
MGLLLAVIVHSANIQDRDGAKYVLTYISDWLPRLQRVIGDGGYRGTLVGWVQQTYGWTLEIVLRTADMVGFEVLPKRWVVERTFGWLGRYRRLSKDYEGNTEVSEAFVYVAMIHLMLRRLAPSKPF